MRVLLLVFVVAWFGTACVDSADLSTTQQGVLEKNRISINRISINRISINRISINRISINRISLNRLALNVNATEELLATPEGRELLQYLIECAIPADQVLEARYQGVDYVFQGQIGLAEKWLDRALKDEEKRWVSGCIISRVNNYDISVPISLRGPHRALEVTASEVADYTVEEGAFYGDIFRPIEEPIVWVACRGRDQAGTDSLAIDDRDCAEPDPNRPGLTKCGFTYAGDCADWGAPATSYACKKYVDASDRRAGTSNELDTLGGGYYDKCYDAAGPGRWPHATQFREVVTIFLQP